MNNQEEVNSLNKKIKENGIGMLIKLTMSSTNHGNMKNFEKQFKPASHPVLLWDLNYTTYLG